MKESYSVEQKSGSFVGQAHLDLPWNYTVNEIMKTVRYIKTT